MANNSIVYELHVPAPKWKPCVTPETYAPMAPMGYAVGAYTAWVDKENGSKTNRDIWLACCQTIQAACSLMWQTGAGQEDVEECMRVAASRRDSDED